MTRTSSRPPWCRLACICLPATVQSGARRRNPLFLEIPRLATSGIPEVRRKMQKEELVIENISCIQEQETALDVIKHIKDRGNYECVFYCCDG